ncbi:hypothetical protein OG345_05015 [Streptomyces sp. NBC_01220]|uniref:hypothetical protein n=1 Tax=Streptomyces sp. NBC_01220 TaxID=2903781 RepID=UPI00352CDEFF|nr:hypothetical protein OG345_05015 [Streptomyces sp. NBC_01220]
MPRTTALDEATAMIEKAWGRPIEELEPVATRRPCDDPLLRSAMHIRSALIVSSTSTAAHQDRLHALTLPGYTPGFYDMERITSSAAALRVRQAENQIALRAISYVIEAREATAPADRPPAARRAQAAVARSAHAPHALNQVPDPAVPAPVTGPPAPAAGPHR